MDSLKVTQYVDTSSMVRPGNERVTNFSLDTGLAVTPFLEHTLRSWFFDPDSLIGDSVSIAWSLLSRPSSCERGDLQCYDTQPLGNENQFSRTFTLQDEFLVFRLNDNSGAFLVDTLKLEYPFIDTSATASNPFSQALIELDSKLDFVLDSEISTQTVTARITNTGTSELRLLSLATGGNDADWLRYQVRWTVPGKPEARIEVQTDTHLSRVDSASPIRIQSQQYVEIDLVFFTDSLQGDAELKDTLWIKTSEYFHPRLYLPFRFRYDDLPLVTISSRSSWEENLSSAEFSNRGVNNQPLPPQLPVYSSLVFSFSEPVLIPTLDSSIFIYSRRDSAIMPQSPERWRIGGTFSRFSSTNDHWLDSIVFVPNYQRSALFSDLKPPPKAFMHKDRIAIIPFWIRLIMLWI